MIDLLTSIPALLGILGGLAVLFWGNGKLNRHKGRKEGKQAVSDALDEAYNDTTKEVRDAQTDLPIDPVDVLDRLRDFAERR
ncbi:hypothetical protein DB2_32 [Octadecabacter Antarctic DB virus 2]|nr:hypothetical protein DB2_32 [Octadecabacter Antarctic DB virus 2]